MASNYLLNSLSVTYSSLDALSRLPSKSAADPGFIYNGTSYTTIDPPGSTDTIVSALNDTGEVAGSYVDGSGQHGFTYNGTSYTTIDPPGSTDTIVSALNDTGEVAGYYFAGSGQPPHGFTYNGTSYTTIDPPGSTDTIVSALNDTGEVAGYYFAGSGQPPHGFTYNGTTYTTIDPPGSTSNFVSALNDTGEVAGNYVDSSGQPQHGFTYNGATYTTIDPPGSTSNFVSALNDTGEVARNYVYGPFDDPPQPQHGFTYNGATYTTIDPPGSIFTHVTALNDTGEVAGSYAQHGFTYNGTTYTTIDPPGSTVTNVSALNDTGEVAGNYNPPCYCHGTLILTPRGEIPVEDLAIGDAVVTLLGEAKPIKWIGRHAYDGRFVDPAVLPIHITAGALADGMPKRDLWVSPGHALYVNGRLVKAEYLFNDATIRRVGSVERVEYFHLELEHHDIIFAEAVAAETYVECDNRAAFQNAFEFTALYPGDTRPSWLYCAPRLEWGSAELTEIRRELFERAAALGYETDANPDLHLVLDAGKIVQPNQVYDRHYRFTVPNGTETIWLVSRTKTQAELEAESDDTRRLGVPVAQVVLSDGDLRIEVGSGHPMLCEGFHAADDGFRWTDGRARLPTTWLKVFPDGFTMDVHLATIDLVYRSTERVGGGGILRHGAAA